MGVVRGTHMILNEVFKTMSIRALEVLIDCYEDGLKGMGSFGELI